MSTVLTCANVVENSLVERYLAGKLDDAATEAFEAHYLTCARCQAELRLATAVRAGLTPGLQSRRNTSWLARGGIAVALAAGLAAVLLWPRAELPGELSALGRVTQPPVYLGVPVRLDDPRDADSLFDAAMQLYVAERYDDAAAGLRAALRAGVDAAPAEFFLGSSLLARDEPEAAAVAFEHVIALGETPYLAEAHFYRAKALLRLGRGSDALSELRLAANAETTIGAYARALADSVSEVLQRSPR